MKIFETIKNFFKDLFACELTEDYVVEEEEEETVLFSYYTVDAAMGLYIEYCEDAKSPSTIKGYKNFWKNYFESIRNVELCHLTQDMVQKALDEEIAEGKSEATVKKALYFLKAVLAFAHDNGMMERLDLCEVKVKRPV